MTIILKYVTHVLTYLKMLWSGLLDFCCCWSATMVVHCYRPVLPFSVVYLLCSSLPFFFSSLLLFPLTSTKILLPAIATWFPLLSPPIFLLRAKLLTMQKPPLLSLLCTAAPSAVMAFASRAFPSVISSSFLQHHGTYGCQGHVIKTR